MNHGTWTFLGSSLSILNIYVISVLDALFYCRTSFYLTSLILFFLENLPAKDDQKPEKVKTRIITQYIEVGYVLVSHLSIME